MHLIRLVARGFRNLEDVDLDVPERGIALLGRNGQGKTNLLEAVCYPVLMRSFRGVPDADVAGFGGPGFRLEAWFGAAAVDTVSVTWTAANRRKRVTCDGADEPRLSAAIGRWLAVVFLPDDVALAGGGASERRQYLDRMLSLADRGYLLALVRYRKALLQRNAALRQGRPDVVQACDPVLARAGAFIVAARSRWCERMAAAFADELSGLGEPGEASLRYRGRAELAEPAAWVEALRTAAPRDRQRGLTTVGPHRDDVELGLAGRSLRAFGSTGQLRSAAIALKLLELETLRAARGAEP
ncbi:MAG TPA: DNA replication and repair protein RecF, partial [Gemmatimonadales bacterium]|nr:DNA replication and repair protein RecF [Gemmatimonadales bacterium]